MQKKEEQEDFSKVFYIVSFSADEAFDGSYPTNVVLTSEGGCTYIPPGIFKSTCKIDITWFPFDDQDCEMKFGSWTYDGGKVSTFQKIERKKNLKNTRKWIQRLFTTKLPLFL